MKMKQDTGAVVSVMSEEWYQRHLCQYPLKEINMRLKDYQGNSLKVNSVVWAPVKYEKEDQTLPIVVVEGNRPALLRRNWLEKMKLDWANIFQMTEGSKKSFHKQVESRIYCFKNTRQCLKRGMEQ